MSALIDAAERMRRALDAQDAAARALLDAAYRDVQAVAQAQMDELAALMRDRIERGLDIPISWIYRAAQLPALLAAVSAELARALPAIEAVIVAQREAAAAAGADDALELLREAVGRPNLTLVPLRPSAVVEAVGQQGAGALRLLADLPADAAGRIERAMVRGIALGQGPERISRSVAEALDGNRARARTIARTEFHRVHRETSRRAWIEQGDLVVGWSWLSSLDRRTCPSCVAMHGTEHALDEPMGSHPNCRCTMVPLLRQAGARAPRIDSGVVEFERWPEARQLETVGPGRLAALRDGRIELADLVRERFSPTWGVTRSVASIEEALANAGRRRLARAA